MIRIGIYGYGNLGRGVESAIRQNKDMELVAVFTRRDPATLKIRTESAKVCHTDDTLKMKDEIDVMILCGGSAVALLFPYLTFSFEICQGQGPLGRQKFYMLKRKLWRLHYDYL